MSFGALVAVGLLVLVTVVLNVFFRFSTTFGSTYGPLAGIIALALWAYATAIAFLVGAALAAQLEAVRASAGAPRSVTKLAESELSSRPSTSRARPLCGRPVDDHGGRLPRRSCRRTYREAPARARGDHGRARHRGQLGRGTPQRQRDLPRHAREHRRRHANYRPVDVRLLARRDRDEVRGGPRRARPRRRPRPGAARRLGLAPDRAGRSSRRWTRRGCTSIGSALSRGCRPHKTNHRTHRKVLVVDEEIGVHGRRRYR